MHAAEQTEASKPQKIDRFLSTGTADPVFLSVVKKLSSSIRSIDDYDSFLEDNIDVIFPLHP
jgi:hypothetical protein